MSTHKIYLTHVFYPILITFLMGYLAFVPIGPYPFTVMGGIQLQHIFTLGLFATSLIFIPKKIDRQIGLIFISILIYFFVCTLSTVTSGNLEISFGNLQRLFCYTIITLIVPFATFKHINRIRLFLFITATIVSFVILYLYFVLNWGTIVRFALAASSKGAGDQDAYVDSNMTAIGLMMSAIIYCPNLLQLKKVKLWIASIGMAAIFSAAICFTSRTVIVSCLFGFFFGMMALLLRYKGRAIVNLFRHYIVITIFLLPMAIWFQWKNLVNILMKFGIGRAGPVDSARTDLIVHTLDIWSQNIQTILLGNGYKTLNPHNELITALTTGGVLGFFAFILLLGLFYFVCCTSRYKNGNLRNIFSQNLLFGYLFFIIQFYGHTKTLWVALMFLLANHIHNRYVITCQSHHLY